MRAFLSLVPAVWLIGVVSLAQQPAVLDFTVIPNKGSAAPTDSGSTGIVAGKPGQTIGGVGTGITLPVLPVSITLKSVTPNVCAPGERIIYEVELTNRGTSGFSLPWSTLEDDTDPERVPPGYQKLTISLMADRPKTGLTVLGHVSVASGSDLSLESLRAVKPGERVLLRAPSACPMSSFGIAAPATGAGVVVPVFAAIMIRLKPNVDGALVQSSKFDVTVVQ